MTDTNKSRPYRIVREHITFGVMGGASRQTVVVSCHATAASRDAALEKRRRARPDVEYRAVNA